MLKHTAIVFTLLIWSFCYSQNHSNMPKYTNALINETSPYLLQHAHNPVNWLPFNETNLAKAKTQNKLIIISVGYAACHWCHVMEHESFEDETVAQLMNDNYINLKVDREERPDVDQVYMNAVQLMTGRGGWPLNVVCLPDGRPVWGGTYFRKNDWMNALDKIAELYIRRPEELQDYANKLAQGMTNMDLITPNLNAPKFSKDVLEDVVRTWAKQLDYRNGGYTGAPKFMMPNNYLFLLRYAHQNKDTELLDFVNHTLTKMAYGGIYDQVGGGFSRYSVDERWHVPHFEKMLYDNAQLVSLYSDAYRLTKNQLYKTIVEETLAFINRELTSDNGIFYSSLDADSLDDKNELEEGAFYVWTKDELKQLLNDTEFQLFSEYYNINSYGHWEHGNYVLIKNQSDETFCKLHNLSSKALNDKLKSWKSLLLSTREKRSRPRLDDKTLTSWNALMIKGYVDAYRAFGNADYLQKAKDNARFIKHVQLQPEGHLLHNYKNGKSTINGFLEDYATTIDAFLALYQVTFNEQWLNTSRDLTNYCFDHFFNDDNSMFYFTSNTDIALVNRPVEYRDNVIAASNSMMAKSLFLLSHYYDNEIYLKTSEKMLNNIKDEALQHGSGFSNWLDLMLNFTNPYFEIAIVGQHAIDKTKTLQTHYIPNALIVGSTTESKLPLLQQRYNKDETFIYVCVNSACKLPTTDIEQALKQM